MKQIIIAWIGQKTVQHGLAIVFATTVALALRVITMDMAIAAYTGAVPLLGIPESPVAVSSDTPLKTDVGAAKTAAGIPLASTLSSAPSTTIPVSTIGEKP